MARSARPIRLRLAVLAVVSAAALPAMAADLRLVMFEREGCIYCRQWHEQIGPAYPKTPEGAAAPLVQLDIHDPLPDGMALTGGPPVITPTFVLTDGGTEVARLTGYAGDEFFWVLLGGMLAQAGWTAPTPAATTPALPTPALPADAVGTAPAPASGPPLAN